jgi:hypothetical protein
MKMSAIGVCRILHNLGSIGRKGSVGKTTDGIPQSVLLNHRLAAECSKTVDFGRLQLSGGRTYAVGLPACSGSGTICSSRCEQRQRRCDQNCHEYAGPARKMVAGIAECHPEKNSGGTAPARKQISNAAHNGTDGDEGGPVGHSGGSSRLVDSKPLGRTVP